MPICPDAITRCNTKDTLKLLDDSKFFAMREEVDIIPRFSTDEPVETIDGQFGPFRAHSVARVPLWAALLLERMQKCTIEIPAWLHEEELKRMRDEEKAEPKRFMKVPEYYIEIAFALLTRPTAFENSREKDRTVQLLYDLMAIRRQKISEGLMDFQKHPTEMIVSDISAAELACFRSRSLRDLDACLELLAIRRVGELDAAPQPGEATATQEDSSTTLM